MAAAVVVWAVSAVQARQAPPQASASTGSAEADEFPDDEGREAFLDVCGQCHAPGFAVATRRSRADWTRAAVEMKDRGAIFTDEDATIILEYLTDHFGTTLNVNKASTKEISSFLKLSSDEAKALVGFRDAQGPFKGWDDLTKAPGLDVTKIEKQKGAIAF
jgi:competence ComEA-like helix-hairpin-helix protein